MFFYFKAMEVYSFLKVMTRCLKVPNIGLLGRKKLADLFARCQNAYEKVSKQNGR